MTYLALQYGFTHFDPFEDTERYHFSFGEVRRI